MELSADVDNHQNPKITIKIEPPEDSRPEVILPHRSYLNPESDEESGFVTMKTVGKHFTTKIVHSEHMSSDMEATLETYEDTEFALKTETEEDLSMLLNMKDRNNDNKNVFGGKQPEMTSEISDISGADNSKTALCHYPKRNILKKLYTEDEITIDETFIEFPFSDQLELESKLKLDGEEFCSQVKQTDSTRNEDIQHMEKKHVCEERVQNKESGLDKSKFCSCVNSWTYLNSDDFDPVTELVYTGPLPYTCKICGKEIPFIIRKGSQKIHNTDQKQSSPHLKVEKYECSLCGKKFHVRCQVKPHIRTVHMKEKLFECPHCGQLFGKCGGLRNHIQSVHLKLKPFECQQCGQKFAKCGGMRDHVQSVHLKLKPFECQHCEQKFGNRYCMKRHIRIVHLKEKNYECQHCGHMFAQKATMNSHIQIVHLKEKQFECQHCGQRFGQKANMKVHLRAVHLKVKQ